MAAAAGGAFSDSQIHSPARGLAELVVPLPGALANSGEGGATSGFMAKLQVRFPQTHMGSHARRIVSKDYTDSHGYTWRLVLYPSGHGAAGCYSAFLELANADSLPPGFSRHVKLEFAMIAWDAAYQFLEPLKTKFLLHRFDSQSTDFGYMRAFEHEAITARHNTLIDPQGYVRVSVKIIDVQEVLLRVMTGVTVTGRADGEGRSARCTEDVLVKFIKDDILLDVIQTVARLMKVPMASCRPWLCMTMSENERLVDPFCPCAPVLPEHMQMTLGKALGNRPLYHIYLENTLAD